MNRKILLTIFGVALLGLGCQRTVQPPAVQAKPQTAPAQSQAKALQTTHEALLAEAEKLPRPEFMPVPQAAAAHAVQAQVAPAPAEPPLPPVAPDQQVHLVLTSGVVGEIDPCG